ncbi:MAG: hypothetical protein J6T68_03580, partial [Candidatus Methanomethylophilaceae archaeon]|nr:hypothetical protein [Candidatus Methanomethylophilaceae archaeon]
IEGSIINYCDKMSIESDYFMRMDSSPYKGEWIAIHGESVVAHSKSLKEVHKQACAQYNMSSLLFVPVLGDGYLFLPTESLIERIPYAGSEHRSLCFLTSDD